MLAGSSVQGLQYKDTTHTHSPPPPLRPGGGWRLAASQRLVGQPTLAIMTRRQLTAVGCCPRTLAQPTPTACPDAIESHAVPCRESVARTAPLARSKMTALLQRLSNGPAFYRRAEVVLRHSGRAAPAPANNGTRALCARGREGAAHFVRRNPSRPLVPRLPTHCGRALLRLHIPLAASIAPSGPPRARRRSSLCKPGAQQSGHSRVQRRADPPDAGLRSPADGGAAPAELSRPGLFGLSACSGPRERRPGLRMAPSLTPLPHGHAGVRHASLFGGFSKGPVTASRCAGGRQGA